jgi:hypothetical protein
MRKQADQKQSKTDETNRKKQAQAAPTTSTNGEMTVR